MSAQHPTRLRFSLRTLLLTTLAIGSAVMLARNSDPWVLLKTLPTRGTHWVEFSTDSGTLLTTDAENACLWDLASGTVRTTFSGHSMGVYCVTFSPDGKRVATAGMDQQVFLWDPATGKCLQSVGEKYGGYVNAIQFSNDGNCLLTASEEAAVWNLDTNTAILHLSLERKDPCSFACYSPDGLTIVGTGMNGFGVRMWDAHTGAVLVPRFADGAGISNLSFSPDGKRLVVPRWQDNHAAQLWNLKEQKMLLDPSGPAEPPDAARFSRDGRQFITTNRDRCTYIYDATSGARLTRIAHNCGQYCHIDLTRDGEQMVIGGESGVTLWKKCRPEYRWGYLYRIEFWTTCLFAGILLLSVHRDRTLRAKTRFE